LRTARRLKNLRQCFATIILWRRQALSDAVIEEVSKRTPGYKFLAARSLALLLQTMRVNFMVMLQRKNYQHLVAMLLPKFCQIGVGRKRIGSSLFSTINRAEIGRL